jgi:hypothetical protein
VNTKLELYPMQTVERQAARLRAERVEAAACHAREVVERVLWDRENRWEESQRFGLDHHLPIHPEESCGQGGWRGVQAGSVTGENWGLQEWAWRSPREAEVDPGGWPEGVGAGPSEAWTNRPAYLDHADLHKSEDRLKEAVEAEGPQPREASSGAPREQAPQGGEREGWLGSCRRAQHQIDLSRRAGTAVSKKRRLPSVSERWREAKRRPAQRLSCEARTHGFVCLQEVATEDVQGEQSGCQEDTTPNAERARAEMRAIF